MKSCWLKKKSEKKNEKMEMLASKVYSKKI